MPFWLKIEIHDKDIINLRVQMKTSEQLAVVMSMGMNEAVYMSLARFITATRFERLDAVYHSYLANERLVTRNFGEKKNSLNIERPHCETGKAYA